MDRDEFKELKASYKEKAKTKWRNLKKDRHKRPIWGLPVTPANIRARLNDRAELKAWKKKIKTTKDKDSRKAQKSGYKYFKKLQHRSCKLTVLAIVVLLAVWLPTWWYTTATKPLTASQVAARDASLAVASQVMSESMVLLKNDSLLPLSNTKVNVFGAGATNMVYGGGGAGGISTSNVTTLFDALSEAGFTYNESLYNLYSNYAFNGEASRNKYTPPSKSLLETLLPSIAGFLVKSPTEMPSSLLRDDDIVRARQFSDTAVYVVSRAGMETIDFQPDELKLSNDELSTLRRLNDNFTHVILLLNTTNVMEIAPVADLDRVQAIVWIGAPGEVGNTAVAAMLKGHVNPSGRLTDTYAYSLHSNPAIANTGSFKYNSQDGVKHDRYFTNNLENIYVGYRYYDTFVDDEDYDNIVQYPFGYGLSYTTFDWKVGGAKTDDSGKISIPVTVTNTGDIAGKDIVQLYYTPPFTQGGTEKSAINLADFAKTSLLKPGESEQLTVQLTQRDMASYDDRNAKAWVLDAGQYDLKIARNVRDVADILRYNVPNQVVYTTEAATGATVTNRFDAARGSGLTYLSRWDPQNTMPTPPTKEQLAMPDAVANSDYKHVKSNGPVPTTGAQNNLKLADLKGLPYDDPKWNTFLDQLKPGEMIKLAGDGGYWSTSISRLGVPRTSMYDGPAAIRSFLGAWSTVAYPIPANLSATWNKDLALQVGKAMGAEAKTFNVDATYAPSLNMHRSPLGGRNFEYYSEDPVIAGQIGANVTAGLKDSGVIAIIKHFAGNDQESHRADYGLYVWATEQSLREIYLKPFQIAVEQGGAHGVMSAFNRIGATWAGGDKALLTDVLRGEWGFDGFVITDAGIGPQGVHFDALQAVEAGNDLMLSFLMDLPIDNNFESQLKHYLKQDEAGTLTALRSAAHNILYYVLQTDKVE